MSKKASSKPTKALSTVRQAVRKGSSRSKDLVNEGALISDLRDLIQSARQRITVVANSTTTLLYWHLGHRLLTENLENGRAEYGKKILATVPRELTAEFGRGFLIPRSLE